jgi:enoyl-CoA hydratase/carnithine racemase
MLQGRYRVEVISRTTGEFERHVCIVAPSAEAARQAVSNLGVIVGQAELLEVETPRASPPNSPLPSTTAAPHQRSVLPEVCGWIVAIIVLPVLGVLCLWLYQPDLFPGITKLANDVGLTEPDKPEVALQPAIPTPDPEPKFHSPVPREQSNVSASQAESAWSLEEPSDQRQPKQLAIVPPVPVPAPGSGYVIPISGVIGEECLYEGVADAIDSYVQVQTDYEYLVLEIDSPGGSVQEAFRIMEALAQCPGEKIALVNSEAISAAMYIAVCCDYILMAPGGAIGAATPYYDTPDGPRDISAKMLAARATHVAAAAELHGHPVHLIRAMIQPSTSVVTWPDPENGYLQSSPGCSDPLPPDHRCLDTEETVLALTTAEAISLRLAAPWDTAMQASLQLFEFGDYFARRALDAKQTKDKHRRDMNRALNRLVSWFEEAENLEADAIRSNYRYAEVRAAGLKLKRIREAIYDICDRMNEWGLADEYDDFWVEPALKDINTRLDDLEREHYRRWR